MAHVDRFSVSLDTELLAAFDRHIADRGYGNRSEAIRDLIRDLLTQSRIPDDREEVSAVVTVVCDQRVPQSVKGVRDLLAASPDLAAGSLHMPIDEHRDGLAISLRGPGAEVQALADRIKALKGIMDGQLWAVPVQA